MSELGNKFLGPFPIGLSFLLFIFSANFRGCWCEWKDDSYTKDPRLLLKAYRRSRTYKGWWVLFFFWILKGQQDWSGYSSISGQTWDCRECDVLLNKRKRDLLISLPLSWFEALIHCRLSLTWNFYYNVCIYIYISTILYYCIILKDIFIHTNCTVPYFDTNWCSCIKWVFIISCLSDNLKHLIFHCSSKYIHIIVWREDFFFNFKDYEHVFLMLYFSRIGILITQMMVSLQKKKEIWCFGFFQLRQNIIKYHQA